MQRVSDYVMDMGKAYEATVSMGRSTTTEDQTGDTLETKGVHSADFNKDDIDRLLESFKVSLNKFRRCTHPSK